MKFFFLITFILLTVQAFSRDFEAILKDGVLKVATVKSENLLDLLDKIHGKKYYLKGHPHLVMQTLESFSNYVSKKYKKELKLEIKYIDGNEKFWLNDSGKFIKNRRYTPKLFKEVDLYADVMTIFNWRKRLAYPIRFYPERSSILCNFYSHRRMNSQDLFQHASWKIYLRDNPKIKNPEKKLGVSRRKIRLFNGQDEILIALSSNSHKEKACTVMGSDIVVTVAGLRNLYFSGFLNNDIEEDDYTAWWVQEKGSLSKVLNDFFRADISDYNESFARSFGISLNIYKSFLGAFNRQ